MPRVMISYRNVPDQKAFAQELNNSFEAAGVETWLDIKDIPAFSKWEDAIIDGIKNSDYVALCLSQEYFESEICMMECYIARGYHKKILPIWLAQDPSDRYWDKVGLYTETEGLQYRFVVDINHHNFRGLSLSRQQRIGKIIKAVIDPVPRDQIYDVYISYRYTHAEYATRIADDLNEVNISTFVMTKHVNIGDEYHEVGWNAMLQARYHIVIMTPDLEASAYIKNEIRVSRTKQTEFIPILAEDLVDDEQAQSDILNTFTSREFALLNDYQWLRPDKGYDKMMQDLISYLNKSKANSRNL